VVEISNLELGAVATMFVLLDGDENDCQVYTLVAVEVGGSFYGETWA
jgi:hypothetical protein